MIKLIKKILNGKKRKPKEYISLGVAVKECRKCDRVEQLEGRWINKTNIPNNYVCSVCGGYAWSNEVTNNVIKSRYCPHCGAYMMKGE